MSLDRTNLKRNAEKIVNPTLDRIGRAIALELGSQLIRETPVDTGRARCNWNTSVGNPDPTTTSQKVKSGAPAIGELTNTITVFKISQGKELYLTNGLPYIGRLNNGHSRQAGKRWIEAAALRMQNLIPQIARSLRHHG